MSNLYAKNISGGALDILGTQVDDGNYHLIEALDLPEFRNSSDIIQKISAQEIILARTNDGLSDITDINTQINELKNEAQKDSDGALLSRQKIAKTGHHYQGMFAVLGIGQGTVDSKKKDGSDIGFWTVTRYDSSDQVTTDAAQAVKTKFEFSANHDIAIIGAKIWQAAPPSESIKIWTEAAPHIPTVQGGQVVFLAGGAELKLMGSGLILAVDGKAPKDIKYDATYFSHKFEFMTKHPVNTDHEIQIEIEYFMPPGI